MLFKTKCVLLPKCGCKQDVFYEQNVLLKQNVLYDQNVVLNMMCFMSKMCYLKWPKCGVNQNVLFKIKCVA